MKESTIDKLPKPTGWRILVLPYKRKEKTKGGIILSDQSLEESQIASSIGLVLKVGPDAYKDREKFPSGAWCKKGDFVVMRSYSGTRMFVDGEEFRMLNDDSIEGVVADPRGFSRAS